MNGSLRDTQFAGLYRHNKINVIDFAVSTFHIHTGKIFVPTETGQAIVMNFHKIQGEVLTLIWHVKFLVRRLLRVAADESL